MTRFLKWIAAGGLAVALAVLSLVGPLDRTPLARQKFYQDMMEQLDTLKRAPYPAQGKLKVGWSKVNLTPGYPMPMAGYTLRPNFESVHDSLFARILAIDNGTVCTYILTADLLLFPPALKEALDEKLRSNGRKEFFYFAGTHTHNGIGGWNRSIAGQFILGDFDKKWVDHATTVILHGIEAARKNVKRASLSYWEADASDYAENRLVGNAGLVDGVLRGFKVVRDDSSKAFVASFSAHPTSISKNSTALSADYPAALIAQAEKNGYDFGMFLAGMVGSHRWKSPALLNFELVEEEGRLLYEKAAQSKPHRVGDSLSIVAMHVPLQLGPAQLRLSKNWKLRNWAFQTLMGKLTAEITYLEIGNLVLLGTSCDFSGEIFVASRLGEFAATRQKNLIITSFNGNYTGYITLDERYDQVDKEEVMALNWVGPYFSQYYAEIITRLLD